MTQEIWVAGSKPIDGFTDVAQTVYGIDEKTGENIELRLYEGRIGRWLDIDPMEQFYSPYEGMGNNPVLSSDPTGGDVSGCCDVDPGIFSVLTTILSWFAPSPSASPLGSTANPIMINEVTIQSTPISNNGSNVSNRLWNAGLFLDSLVPKGGENYQPGAYLFFNDGGTGGLSNGGHTSVGHYYGSNNITDLTYMLGNADNPEWKGVLLDFTGNAKDIKFNPMPKIQPQSKSVLLSKLIINPNGDTVLLDDKYLSNPNILKGPSGEIGTNLYLNPDLSKTTIPKNP